MSTAFSVRTPAQIASEINNIKSENDKMMLKSCVQIGRCLTEAKAVLAHGEWGNWLKESVSYSQRTATHLMRIYREFGPKLKSRDRGLPNWNPDSNLGFTQAVILLGIPAEEREEFMACHDVANMSKRELQEAINEKKQMEQIPVITVRKTGKGKTLPPPASHTATESAKYDEQFAAHRDNMLMAFDEMQKTLVAQNRIDPAGKEINRKKTVEMLTNMAAMMKEYPPKIKTNLQLSGKSQQESCSIP